VRDFITPVAGENAGQYARLFAGAGQQRQQSKDDVTYHPNTEDHSGADGSPDCRASALCVCCQIAGEFTELTEIADQPHNHQDVEQDKQPFEDFPENPAFWFADRVGAMWAVVCFCRDCFTAARAGRHFGHLKFLKSNQLLRDSSRSHSGVGQGERQGGATVEILN